MEYGAKRHVPYKFDVRYSNKNIGFELFLFGHGLKIMVSLNFITQAVKTEKHKFGDSFVVFSRQNVII